jgi:hypothetical protein
LAIIEIEEVGKMLVRILRALELVTGLLLGGLGAGIQVGNVLVCLWIVLMLPVVLNGWFTQ